jgi:hypothetical protein
MSAISQPGERFAVIRWSIRADLGVSNTQDRSEPRGLSIPTMMMQYGDALNQACSFDPRPALRFRWLIEMPGF